MLSSRCALLNEYSFVPLNFMFKHLKALNKYFVKYKGRVIFGVIVIILSNLMAVIPAQVIGYVLDFVKENVQNSDSRILPHQNWFLHLTFDWINQAQLIKVVAYGGGVLLALALLKGFFMFLMREMINVMSRYIEVDLKDEIYSHYQKMDLNFFKTHNTGDLMNRIATDVSRVRYYVGPSLMYSTNLIILITVTVYFMFQVNVKLTLFTLIPLPILAFIIYYVNKIIHRKSERIQEDLSELTTLAQEDYSGIRVIKSYVEEESNKAYFDKASQSYMDSSINLAKTEALYRPSMQLMIGLSTLITVMVGGIAAIHGEITVGNIAEFVVYVNLLMWPVASIGMVMAMIQRASASQKRINQFLDVQPEIFTPPNAIKQEIKGNIQFENVQFTYPHTGIKALKDFNLNIKAGEKIAVIGRTGSGKSTLAHLLIRMYDPQAGSVSIDGVPVNKYDLTDLRSQVSLVPQEVFLFSDTIEGNIRFGKPEVTLEQIKQAARAAVIEKDILEFSNGFHTKVGERGVSLSGGQRQRVSIARALVKDPNLLIFDDCLSAVDADTEQRIIGGLYKYLQDKTALIITHRIFSTFKFDQIIVMDDGRIAEKGTHEELLSRGGLYTELYEKQQETNQETVSK